MTDSIRSVSAILQDIRANGTADLALTRNSSQLARRMLGHVCRQCDRILHSYQGKGNAREEGPERDHDETIQVEAEKEMHREKERLKIRVK